MTVFVTTHHMEEAEYCNRLALIVRGQIVALGTPSELKQKSMKGELLLVECEPLGSAVEVLQSAPDVIDAAVFGNALHLVVRNAGAAIPQVEKYLADHGIRADTSQPGRRFCLSHHNSGFGKGIESMSITRFLAVARAEARSGPCAVSGQSPHGSRDRS